MEGGAQTSGQSGNRTPTPRSIPGLAIKGRRHLAEFMRNGSYKAGRRFRASGAGTTGWEREFADSSGGAHEERWNLRKDPNRGDHIIYLPPTANGNPTDDARFAEISSLFSLYYHRRKKEWERGNALSPSSRPFVHLLSTLCKPEDERPKIKGNV